MLYRVVVKYLGHGEGGNATAWASAWKSDKDEWIEDLKISLSEISEGVGSHLKLDTQDGGSVVIHAAVLQRSVLIVERREGNGGGGQVPLDELTKYSPRVYYENLTGHNAIMGKSTAGKYVKLADVRALLDQV